jgi:hypothetical protein
MTGAVANDDDVAGLAVAAQALDRPGIDPGMTARERSFLSWTQQQGRLRHPLRLRGV